MVKLTPDIFEISPQFTNPIRDRELDLRGYKIPVIENMGASLDQFDTIDLSDNEIRKVDGFPLLKRLKTLFLNNNRIVRIGENIELSLPNLESLILTNNNISELGDLDTMSTIESLHTLSLMRNPVTTKKYYRLYLIHKIPQLRLIDFQKVKLREREAARKIFKGRRGKEFFRDIGKKTKTFVAGKPIETPGDILVKEMTKAQIQDISDIKAAIANATTLEEVEMLNAQLQSGIIPHRRSNDAGDGLDEADEMEVQAAEEEAAAKAKAEVDIIAEALVNESLAMSEEEGGAKDDEPIQAPPPDNDIQAPSTDIESDVPVAMDTE